MMDQQLNWSQKVLKTVMCVCVQLCTTKPTSEEHPKVSWKLCGLLRGWSSDAVTWGNQVIADSSFVRNLRFWEALRCYSLVSTNSKRIPVGFYLFSLELCPFVSMNTDGTRSCLQPGHDESFQGTTHQFGNLTTHQIDLARVIFSKKRRASGAIWVSGFLRSFRNDAMHVLFARILCKIYLPAWSYTYHIATHGIFAWTKTLKQKTHGGHRWPSHNIRQGIVQLHSVIHQSGVATFWQDLSKKGQGCFLGIFWWFNRMLADHHLKTKMDGPNVSKCCISCDG